MRQIMSNNYVAFSCAPQSMRRGEDDIIRIFGRYGNVKKIILPRRWRRSYEECLIVFERSIDAQQCFEDSKTLLDEHNFIIEKARIPDNYMDIQEFEADRGIDNSDLPSLMNLNDDCLSHLLKFLPEELSLGDVSMRMRRLCKRKEKINHFKGSRKNILFHYGPLLTHVSVSFSDLHYLSDLTDFLNLISVRCMNMTFLRVYIPLVVSKRGGDRWLQSLCDIVPSLKELVFDVDMCTSGHIDSDSYAITPILDAVNGARMKKLRINLRQYVGLTFSAFNPTPLTSLSVLIVPKFHIDIGRVLGQLPSLRALACVLDLSEDYPRNHELRDFYGFVPDDKTEWKPDLLSLSKVCPKLRNLRMRGNIRDYEDITNFFPELEGLYLEDCIIKCDGGTFETMKNADLKTFIFAPHTEELILNFPELFFHFRKLEVLFWEERIHGDIHDMLSNRPDSCDSFTVITENQPTEEEKKTKYPKVRWARRLEEFFGPFSIFNVPIVGFL